MDRIPTPAPDAAAPCRLRLATLSDQVLLQRLMELYVHDMSAFWELDVCDDGSFGVEVEDFLVDASRRAYLIELDGGVPAGFALVLHAAHVPGVELWLHQFFVLKRHRGRGLGRRAAMALFDSLPGHWGLGQWSSDHGAQAFWRRTLHAYTAGAYTESWLDGAGPMQRFRSGPGPGRGLELDHADRLDAVVL